MKLKKIVAVYPGQLAVQETLNASVRDLDYNDGVVVVSKFDATTGGVKKTYLNLKAAMWYDMEELVEKPALIT